MEEFEHAFSYSFRANKSKSEIKKTAHGPEKEKSSARTVTMWGAHPLLRDSENAIALAEQIR